MPAGDRPHIAPCRIAQGFFDQFLVALADPQLHPLGENPERNDDEDGERNQPL